MKITPDIAYRVKLDRNHLRRNHAPHPIQTLAGRYHVSLRTIHAILEKPRRTQ